MQFILFRPMCVCALLVHALVLAFLVLNPISGAHAVPQFGRPWMHVLDETPTDVGCAEPTSTSGSSTPYATAPCPTGTGTTSDDDPVDVGAADSASNTSTSSSVSASTAAATSGASVHVGVVHAALAWGAAASVVYLVV